MQGGGAGQREIRYRNLGGLVGKPEDQQTIFVAGVFSASIVIQTTPRWLDHTNNAKD